MTNAELFAGYSPEWFIEKAAQDAEANYRPEPKRLYEPVPLKRFHGPNKGCFFTNDGLELCGKDTCHECREHYR